MVLVFLSCWGVSEDLGWAAQAGGVRCRSRVLRLQTREGLDCMHESYCTITQDMCPRFISRSIVYVMVDKIRDYRVMVKLELETELKRRQAGSSLFDAGWK